MKFYYSPGSSYSRRVEALLLHMGVDVEKVLLDFTKGELKTPEYLAINPMGKVPSLVDGDLKLWESTAIMLYLAEKFGTALYPKEAASRADILRWQSWELTSLGRATGTLNFENLFKPMFMSQQGDPALIEKATADFHKLAPILNGHLEGKKFMLGDELSLADFSLASSFQYAVPAKFPWENYAEIRRWYGSIAELPAWEKSGPDT